MLVVVWYGVLDERLQDFVAGRTVDVHDIYTDRLILAVKLGALLLGKPFATSTMITAFITIIITSSGAVLRGKLCSPKQLPCNS